MSKCVSVCVEGLRARKEIIFERGFCTRALLEKFKLIFGVSKPSERVSVIIDGRRCRKRRMRRKGARVLEFVRCKSPVVESSRVNG